MAALVNGLGGNVGFGETGLPRMDDSPPRFVDVSSVFANGLNFYGKTYTELYVNYNGSITFGSGLSKYSPTAITGNSSIPIIAPYWADTDTRGGSSTITPGGNSQGTNQIWFDRDTINKTFTATWDDVGYYFQSKDKLNAFQVQLVAVGTLGDFDIHFIYETLQWTTGDASGGTDGFGGLAARAGFSAGDGVKFFELAPSGTADMVNLTKTSNIKDPGHYVFSVRNGIVSLFTGAGDTVDFNNLTVDQKASIAGGSDEYGGLGGSDTVYLPSPENYDQVVGKTSDGAPIKLGWSDTAASSFHTQSRSGDVYTVHAGEGDHHIVTGDGKDVIDIKGNGDNTIVAGPGTVDITIETDSGDGSNSIFLGGGDSSVALTRLGFGTGKGTQRIETGSGHVESLMISGSLGRVEVQAAKHALDTTIFDAVEVKASSTPLELHGYAEIGFLDLPAGATLVLGTGAYVKVNEGGADVDPSPSDGTIVVGSGATLELVKMNSVTATLGTGTGTLILHDVQHKGFSWYFNPLTAPTKGVGFEIDALAPGDRIVLKGYNPSTELVHVAALGDYLLSDSTARPALHLGGIGLMAINSIVGTKAGANQAYFDVALSADSQDTVLTLKVGNNVDVALRGPQARAAHDVTGKGVRIGILSESFATDGAALGQDIANGVLPPSVLVLREGPDDFTSPGYDRGRAMAGLIHAIAPGAEIFFYAPAGASGQSGFADGVNALREEGCDIIVDDLEYTALSEYISTIDSTIESAVRAGVTFITAAGDGGAVFPVHGHAANPSTITVAAMNALAVPSAQHPSGRYLPAAVQGYSSLGGSGKPDVTGVDTAQTSFHLSSTQNPSYGTGIAAASVAAVAALILNANPLLFAEPEEVRRILETTAFLFGNFAEAGAGVVRADAAVANALLVNRSFYDASGDLPAGMSLSIPVEAVSISPAAPHPITAALSVPAGNAGTGATVLMLVSMDRGVVVTGQPSFTLSSGGVFRYDSELSSPTAGRLLFTYTVGAGEQAANLSITGFTGAIDDSGGSDADFSPLFAVPTGLTINSPLKVSSVGRSGSDLALAGDTIEITLTLSKGATLDSAGGSPTLVLNNGGKTVYDGASSDPSTGRIVFDYVVGAADRTSDLAVASVNLPHGTTLRDGTGNNADFTMAEDRGLGVQVGPVFVDAVLPEIDGTAVATGQAVALTIALSQAVMVDLSKGSPVLTLGNGAKAAYDAAASDPSKGILVFDYKVGAADKATNLLVTGIALNGSTIRDSHGKDADLAGAQNVSTGLTINSPLTVETIAASKAGSIRTGDTVQLSLTLETKLEVRDVMDGGLPTLALNDGGTAVYNAAASTPDTGKLVFDYTVGTSAQATASLVITRFNQNGSILFDDKGNFADLSDALNVPTGLKVVVSSSASIEATAAIKPEGQSGSSAFVFTVRLDGPAVTSETVAWAVTGSGANLASASDFSGGVLASGVVTFAAGETSKGVVVTVLGDTAVEASESFTVTLSAPSAGLVIGTATASGTIVNDDSAVSIAATTAAKAEGNGGTTASTSR